MKAPAKVAVFAALIGGVIAMPGPSDATRSPTESATLISYYVNTFLDGSTAGETVTVKPLGQKIEITDSAGITPASNGEKGCRFKSSREVICRKPRDLQISGGDGTDHIKVVGNLHIRKGRDRFEDGVSLEGGDGPDLVIANRGGSFIFGGKGTDSLHAGGGLDFVKGDGGRDSLYGGPGHDRVIATNHRSKSDPDNVIDCGGGKDTYRVGDDDPKPHRCERRRPFQ